MTSRDSDHRDAIHHYVPQGYLKKFSLKASTNQVYAYELNKNPYLVNIHKVTGQRDFYTFIDPINDDMKLDIFDYDQEAVDYINYYTYFYADRWILANVANNKFTTEFKKANSKEPLWKMG